MRRLKKLRDVDYTSEWVMVIVTIGTEEVDYFLLVFFSSYSLEWKKAHETVTFVQNSSEDTCSMFSFVCNVANRITMLWSELSIF